MAGKLYKFEFYQCVTLNSNSVAPVRTPSEVFQGLLTAHASGVGTEKQIGGTSFEIRLIEATSYGFKGVIGRHRSSELPHAAQVGGAEREIALLPNENLLEKAHFAFYHDYQVLILQNNFLCINDKNFSSFLSSGGYVTTLNPIIEAADLAFLMDGRVQVRTAEMSIARPTNKELFENATYDLTNSIIRTLNGSGAPKLQMAFRGDGRTRTAKDRYLDPAIKQAVREFQTVFDVKQCKLMLEHQDTLVSHPLDLVADRLVFTKKIHHNGRYPPVAEVWQALLEARQQKEGELLQYFGDPSNRII